MGLENSPWKRVSSEAVPYKGGDNVLPLHCPSEDKAPPLALSVQER